MNIAPSPIYTEVYEFLASSPSREEILNFRPSDDSLARLSALRDRERQADLSPEEAAELDEWERVEHLVRMVKLTSRKQMQQP